MIQGTVVLKLRSVIAPQVHGSQAVRLTFVNAYQGLEAWPADECFLCLAASAGRTASVRAEAADQASQQAPQNDSDFEQGAAPGR